MKPHTPEQIEGLKGFSESTNATFETYQLGNVRVDYYVINIPDEQKPPLDYPVAAAFTEKGNSQEGIIAVSDDVPDNLRGLWALHEYIDFTQNGHEHPSRCLSSEEYILGELEKSGQAKLSQEYIQARVRFHQQLASLMKSDIEGNGSTSQYDNRDLEGAETVIQFLKQNI